MARGGTLSTLVVKLQADASGMSRELAAARRDIERLTAQVRGMGVQVSASMRQNAVATRAMADGITKLRGPLLTLSNQLLHLTPGVGQLSAALGTMAVGSPVVVGVLAGIAAIGFAWKKLTSEAREAKKAQQEAREEAQKLIARQNPAEELLKIRAPLQAQFTMNEAEITRLRNKIDAGFTNLEPKLEKAEELQAALRREIEAVDNELLKLQGSASDFGKVMGAVADRAAASMRQSREEIRKIIDEIKRMHEMAPFDLQPAFTRDQLRKQLPFEIFAAGGGTQRPLNAQEAAEAMGFFAPTIELADEAMQNLINSVDRATNELQKAALGPNGELRKRDDPRKSAGIFGLLDPTTIASNVAANLLSGGVQSVVSQFVKIGANLIGFSDEAERAARRLARAREEWAQSLQDFIDIRSGALTQEFVNQRNWLEAQWKELLRMSPRLFMGQAGLGGVFGTPTIPEFDFDTATIEEIQQFFRDLLNIEGLNDVERALIDKLARAAELSAESLNEMNASIVNAARGFKIDRFRFNATQGVQWTPPTAAMIGTPQVGGGETINIIQQPGEDSEALAKRVARELRMSRTRGGTTEFDLAVQ